MAVGRIRNKSEKGLKNPEKSGDERNRKGNNFVAVGTSRKMSAKSRNERNRKGNNFVAVGRIRNKSEKGLKNPEKSGDERNMKGNNFAAVRCIRSKSEKLEEVGRYRKGEEQEGEQFCGGRTRPEIRKNPKKIPTAHTVGFQSLNNMGPPLILSRPDAPRKSRQNPESPQQKGNERNMKGNNFLTTGHIRKKSEKSRKSENDRNMKGNNFVTAGRIRKSRKNPEKEGT